MYHRVAEPTPGAAPPTQNVPPGQLRRQLGELLERGYQPWPLRKALDYSRRGAPIPRRAFVVTFDDGYENNCAQAWPVLRELQVPATIFLATAYLDGQEPFPFDDWPAAGSADVPADSWRPLTTAQCAAMLADGLIELGTHTHTHANFRGKPESLREELRVSQALLRQRFGLMDATFAFPFGISSGELSQAARQAGVLCALTTQEDLVTPGCDPYAWGRFGVREGDNGQTLAAKLDGWYSLARSLWLRVRKPAAQAAAPSLPRAALSAEQQ